MSAAAAKTATRPRSRRADRRSIRASCSTAPLLLLLLPVPLIDARLQVRTFRSPDREVRRRGPGLDVVQSRTSQEEARVAVGASPLGRDAASPWFCRRSSRASSIQVRSRPQALSSASCAISIVGSRVAGSRSNVRSRCRPKVSHGVDRRRVHLEIVEFTPRDAASGVLAALSERDQPQEDLFDGSSPLLVGRFVDAVGSGGQGAGDPADLPVRGEGQPSSFRRSKSSVSAYCRSGSAPG